MIVYGDKKNLTLKEKVLKNKIEIAKLLQAALTDRWSDECVDILGDVLMLLEYDDKEQALELIDALIAELGGTVPYRPTHTLIGLSASYLGGVKRQGEPFTKDDFIVTALYEDGEDEIVDDYVIIPQRAYDAPQMIVRLEYDSQTAEISVEVTPRYILTLNDFGSTTVVCDLAGEVLHSGDYVFEGEVLQLASSQPNANYEITGRTYETNAQVYNLKVGDKFEIHGDTIVNIFTKYVRTFLVDMSGVDFGKISFVVVDDKGDPVVDGDRVREGSHLTVYEMRAIAHHTVYPHAVLVGGEMLQIEVGTVITVSSDVVFDVGALEDEKFTLTIPTVEHVTYRVLDYDTGEQFVNGQQVYAGTVFTVPEPTFDTDWSLKSARYTMGGEDMVLPFDTPIAVSGDVEFMIEAKSSATMTTVTVSGFTNPPHAVEYGVATVFYDDGEVEDLTNNNSYGPYKNVREISLMQRSCGASLGTIYRPCNGTRKVTLNGEILHEETMEGAEYSETIGGRERYWAVWNFESVDIPVSPTEDENAIEITFTYERI